MAPPFLWEPLLFEPIKLDVALGDESLGSVSVDGSRDQTDFYSIVSVQGLLSEKRIYGVDPVSALSAGLQLVERLTEATRFHEETDANNLKISVSQS